MHTEHMRLTLECRNRYHDGFLWSRELVPEALGQLQLLTMAHLRSTDGLASYLIRQKEIILLDILHFPKLYQNIAFMGAFNTAKHFSFAPLIPRQH